MSTCGYFPKGGATPLPPLSSVGRPLWGEFGGLEGRLRCWVTAPTQSDSHHLYLPTETHRPAHPCCPGSRETASDPPGTLCSVNSQSDSPEISHFPFGENSFLLGPGFEGSCLQLSLTSVSLFPHSPHMTLLLPPLTLYVSLSLSLPHPLPP